MRLHTDLLFQVRDLATREPRRPKQASLRRSISAAYYALFHLLSDDAARLFVKDPALANIVKRKYDHRTMVNVSKRFANGEWPSAFDAVKSGFQVPWELRNVAQTFVALQEERHHADYNLSKVFTRGDAVVSVDRAERAFEAWKTIRRNDLARIYLACFLDEKLWNRSR